MAMITALVLRTGRMYKQRPALGNSWRHLHTPPVKEVRIPTSYGELAGKWWGDEHRQPMLALHGWQDNAGTWDKLVPHLPADHPVLALDLPGHGYSAWIPKGMLYTHWFYVRCVLDIMRHYNWEKISFLGHSMGSIIAFRYACVFPETVNFYIAVENIVPDVPDRKDALYSIMAKNLTNLYVDESYLGTEPPSYPYEDVIMRWHTGTRKSVSLEAAHCLVDRGTKQSQSDPTKYYFSRDPRLKHNLFNPPPPEFTKLGIKRLQFPLLYVKGKDSPYAVDELAICSRELLAQTNDKYEFHCIPGTHHVHLNNPEVVGPIVTQFLQKYGTVSSKL